LQGPALERQGRSMNNYILLGACLLLGLIDSGMRIPPC
jgi:hypothetical protein